MAQHRNDAAVEAGRRLDRVNDPADQLVRSLIAAHGDSALAFAERALDNVRSLTMEAPIARWLLVIEAIKTAQAGKVQPSS
jgi:hypothetical protein